MKGWEVQSSSSAQMMTSVEGEKRLNAEQVASLSFGPFGSSTASSCGVAAKMGSSVSQCNQRPHFERTSDLFESSNNIRKSSLLLSSFLCEGLASETSKRGSRF
jgi:hypothetical protein